ncbi:MAG: MBL fold metallo-hydrolase [Candidatus Thorarchaeota archaeon]
MTTDPELAQSIDDFYAAELGPKEFAFIYTGYASILIRTKKSVVALDPSSLFSKVMDKIQQIDLITYSHSHYDHYDFKNAVALYKKTDAHIISEFNMVEELRKKIPEEKVHSGPEDFRVVKGDPKFKLDGIAAELHRGVHPRPIIQLRVSIGRLKVFHAADSGYWPVRNKRVDVAFLPTGIPSPTCHPGVALAMAMDLRPSIAVAVHGEDEQHQKFKELVEHELPETIVVIPRENELVILNKS